MTYIASVDVLKLCLDKDEDRKVKALKVALRFFEEFPDMRLMVKSIYLLTDNRIRILLKNGNCLRFILNEDNTWRLTRLAEGICE